MAISHIKQYAHLSDRDVEALGRELDRIRAHVLATLGDADSRYIHRVIAFQRALEVSARTIIFATKRKLWQSCGVVSLAVAKSVENMEIGHNVMHGQWDWMNDPEIHSTTWEWDMAGPAQQWRHAHNVVHHLYTNIVDMDADVGFGIIRVTRDQPWRPIHLLQPLQNILLAALFEWGIALHDLEADHPPQGPAPLAWRQRPQVKALLTKGARQLSKDYFFFPALRPRRWRQTLTANAAANVLRNLWAYMVIFCGHFPDGAEKFSVADVERETRGEWYLRQMLGTANFKAGPVMAFLSGNLCFQIEHHLFPDLPSNRYRQISHDIRALCTRFDLPYTTGPLLKQYLLSLRTIFKLALPDSFLTANADDAPETASERKFTVAGAVPLLHRNITTDKPDGLASALLRARGRAPVSSGAR